MDWPAFIKRITKLNRDRSHGWSDELCGGAPHKPCLLLAVVDGIEEGRIHTPFIEITDSLCEGFAQYWSAVMPAGKRGDFFKPFFHLRNEGFWELVTKPDHDHAHKLGTVNRMRQLLDNFLGAGLDPDVFAQLQSPDRRDELREIIIATYFRGEGAKAIAATIQLGREAAAYGRGLLERAHGRQLQEDSPDYGPRDSVRDQGFRKAVVTAYAHRCAFCGVRVLTAAGHTIVDAAHIVPWCESRNDAIGNGLCLCKLCHWAFDEYLVSVSDRYRVLTSPWLRSRGNMPGIFLQLEHRELFLPEDDAFYPEEGCLKDHRRRFKRAG